MDLDGRVIEHNGDVLFAWGLVDDVNRFLLVET